MIDDLGLNYTGSGTTTVIKPPEAATVAEPVAPKAETPEIPNIAPQGNIEVPEAIPVPEPLSAPIEQEIKPKDVLVGSTLNDQKQQFLDKHGLGWLNELENLPQNLLKGAAAGTLNTVRGLADITLAATGYAAKFVGADSAASLANKGQKAIADNRYAPEAPGAIGNMAISVGKFAAGFLGAGGLVSKLKYVKEAPAVIQGMSKAAMADFFGFDGHEQRLSDLTQTIPELQNPVSEYLANNIGDSEFERRTKTALEGVALNTLAIGAASGIKAAYKGFMEQGGLETLAKSEAGGVVPKSKVPSTEEIYNLKKPVAGVPPKVSFSEEELQALSDPGFRAHLKTLEVGQDNKSSLFSPEEIKSLDDPKFIKYLKTFAEDESGGVKVPGGPKDSAGTEDFDAWISKHEELPKETPEANMVVKGTKAIKDLAPDGWTESGKVNTIENQTQELGMKLPAALQNSFFEKMKISKDVTRDVLLGTYQSFLLSAPSTHLKNIIGNTGVALNSLLEKSLARGISKMAGSNDVAPGEILAQFNGMLAGLKQGTSNFAEAFKTNQSKFGSLTKLDVDPTLSTNTIAGGALSNTDNILTKGINLWGKFTGITGRALNAEDEFFKTVAFTQNSYARITRQIAAEGITDPAKVKKRFSELLENLPQDIHTDSFNIAHVNTFTAPLDSFAQSFESLRQAVPSVKFVIPFFKTLANITKYGLQRFPPTGVLFKQFHADMAAGGAKKYEALAKLGSGAIFGILGAALYGNNQITGPGPTWHTFQGFKENMGLKEIGWQAHSIKVGDKYVSYSDFEPLGTIMRMWSTVYYLMDHLEDKVWSKGEEVDKTVGQLVSMASIATASAVMNNSWAEGYSKLISLIFTEDNKGLAKYLQDFTLGFVPNLLRRGTKLSDPHADVREAMNYVEQVKKRIPGLSNELQMHDNAHEPNSIGKRVWDFVSPFSIADIKEPLSGKLKERYGIPDRKSDTIQLFKGGLVADLKKNPEDLARIQQLSHELPLAKYGHKTKAKLLAEVDSGTTKRGKLFHSLSDGPGGGKEKYLNKVDSDYRRAAKDRLLKTDKDLGRTAASKREKMDRKNAKARETRARHKREMEGYKS